MVSLYTYNFHRDYIKSSSTKYIYSLNKDKYSLIFEYYNKFPIKLDSRYSYIKILLPQELVPNTNHASKDLKLFKDFIIKTFNMTYFKIRIIKLNSKSGCYYLEAYYTDREVINDYSYAYVDKYFSKKDHRPVKKYRFNPKLHYVIEAGQPLNNQKMKKKWSLSPSRNSRVYFINELHKRLKMIVFRLNSILSKMNVKRFFFFYKDFQSEGFISPFKITVRIQNKVTNVWETVLSKFRIKQNQYIENKNKITLAKMIRKFHTEDNYINFLLTKYGGKSVVNRWYWYYFVR